jgi:hypothetical protein
VTPTHPEIPANRQLALVGGGVAGRAWLCDYRAAADYIVAAYLAGAAR